MKVLREIDENEMIATFLKGEINSKRFGKHILSKLSEDDKDRSLIDSPDTSFPTDNDYRRDLLANYRGFGENAQLFHNFPEAIKWSEVSLTKNELSKALYINYSYWLELSSGTRLPSAAAENIKRGVEVFGESNKRFLEAAKFLAEGGSFDPMIFVSTGMEDTLVNLEGHLRLTAYFLEPDFIPEEVTCILGTSSDFSNWGLY